ncbi:glycosyltransferase family 4 protein [Novosphingobium guangzhouense]|nr:glycosyltransferase family 4 protein [Novosphingobium guangzhouense]
MLLERLKGCDVVYFAHSTGWGMTMPPEVPILCVSRNTMAYWGRYAPNSYIAHVPNIVELPEASEMMHRDVDVLVQARKSSRYLLERLVPALREHCDVTLLDGWVEDLGAWFRRSKVYLYDSLEHWADVGATEGFGLPPLEAMGHGCTVFSSVNDALADYLDPGFNSHKLRVHSLAWDVDAIVRAVLAHDGSGMVCNGLEIYAPAQVTARLASVLQGVERFFAFTATTEPDIEDIWAQRKPGTLQRAKRAVRLLAGV